MEVAGRGYPAGSRAARGAENKAFFGAIFTLLKPPDHVYQDRPGTDLGNVDGKWRSFCSAAYPGFYGALLDQKVYWEQTLRAEGAVRLELPQTNYSDGV